MKILRAGPIHAFYNNGFLRRISYGRTEIIRMVYFAVRDHNWNTLKHQLENENIEIQDDRFEISYECIHLDGGTSVMEWNVRISGGQNGAINFAINGKATDNFRKNRAGFCVLHPLNVLGEECRLRTPDGVENILRFPEDIAAENPFKNIQAMTWNTSGIPFTLRFEGDIFETEDQRNWADASFKTFCTPLERPFPVLLKKGDKVFQRVSFGPSISLQPAESASPDITLIESTDQCKLPLFGTAASTETDQLSDQAVLMLRALRLSHYRIDLLPSSEEFALHFSNEYERAFRLGLPLEVALHLTDRFPEEMEAFTVICQQNKIKLNKVLLLTSNGLVTSQRVIDQMLPLKSAFPRVQFGVGSNYNFNEVNKNRFHGTNFDFVSFAMDPQEHASDDLTMLENSASLEHLVRSAKSIYGREMPIHLSPVTLKKRFNPYATNPRDVVIDEAQKADARQQEEFAAAWTFGALCSLAKGGASAVTFYQTVGGQGVLSREGVPYPVYETLRNFAPYQGRPVRVLKSSDELSVNAIILDGKVVAIANLAEEEKTTRWNGGSYVLKPREVRFEALNRTQ